MRELYFSYIPYSQVRTIKIIHTLLLASMVREHCITKVALTFHTPIQITIKI